MADGFKAIESTDPLAKVMATDSIGGFDYQVVKMSFGLNDSVTYVSPTSPLPVYILDPNNSFASPDFISPSPIFSKTQFVDVTMTLDTAAYAPGDVIADSQIVAGICPANDMPAILQSLVIDDEDDQGAAMVVWFYSANVSMGTENVAPSITDANSRQILGYVEIAAIDWKDNGGNRSVCKTGCGIGLKPVAGTKDVYMAIVCGPISTPTYTASGLKVRLTAI